VFNFNPEKLRHKIIVEGNIGYPEISQVTEPEEDIVKIEENTSYSEDLQESRPKEGVIKKDKLDHSEISYEETEGKENLKTPMPEGKMIVSHKSKNFYVIEQMR